MHKSTGLKKSPYFIGIVYQPGSENAKKIVLKSAKKSEISPNGCSNGHGKSSVFFIKVVVELNRWLLCWLASSTTW